MEGDVLLTAAGGCCCPDQVPLSRSFQSRPVARQKLSVRMSVVEVGAYFRILMINPIQTGKAKGRGLHLD